MYCTKCGKQIGYDSPICKECVDEMAAATAPAAAVEPTIEQPVIQQPEQTELQPGESAEVIPSADDAIAPVAMQATSPVSGDNPRMRGFGKALTSTILGFIGYFFAVMTMAMTAEDTDMAIAGVVFFILSLPLAIIPFVFGLKSIALFRSTPADTPKPIAALILGIIGLFFAGLSLFVLSIAGIILLGIVAGA